MGDIPKRFISYYALCYGAFSCVYNLRDNKHLRKAYIFIKFNNMKINSINIQK